MGILRANRVGGIGGANAINGSVFFGRNGTTAVASGNWLTAYSADDFSFGTGDFTIEYWFYFTGVSGSNSGSFQISNTSGGLNNANGASTGGLALNYENGCVKGIGNNGWFNGSNSVSVGTWNHAALVRHSGTLQIFTNGAADTSASDSQNYSLTHLAIGGYYSTSHLFQGYISDFRIVKGTAVYSSAFTPPTERLTAIDGTVLLACQSPGNVLQEATGKTLNVRRVNSNDAPPMASRFVPDKGEDHGTTFEDNTKFDTLSYMVPPGGTTVQSNRGRGLIMGGASTPGANNQTAIQYLNIHSLGNTQYFGQLIVSSRAKQAAASSTRGLAFGGFIAPPAPYTVSDAIDYVTIATQSNAIDFGNLSSSGYAGAGVSNNTRGLWAGGYRPNNSAVVDTIDYVTIATLGNATDFGNLIAPQRAIAGGSNTTRGVFGAGAYPAVTDTISYVTIASTGNSTDFGNLTDARDNTAAGSSPTRTCFAGGRDPGTSNIIDYITTATTGNAIDFGDLTMQTNIRHGMASNSLRGVIAGDGNITNSLDYITFATQGDSKDFGDQVSSGIAPVTHSFGVCSDSHGGIS